jgi:hypothetical protein
MAQKKQIDQANARKLELVAQLARTRESITQSKEQLTGKLKPKNLLRNIFARKPKTIFTGSVLVSFLTTLIIRRPKKSRKATKPQTSKAILLSWALSLLKPVAKVWLVNLAKQLSAERLARSSQTRPAQGNSPASDQFIIQR